MSHSERGEVSLTSVLVSCILLIVVLGATLSIFEGFIAKASDGNRRTDAQDVARTAADRIARDLRNLASPTPEQPQALDRSTATDLIFKTVDPAGPNAGANATNTQRVRYCLDGAKQLQQQTQTWITAGVPNPPVGTACPASGWTRTTIQARSIVNNAQQPVFTSNSTVLTDVSEIHVDLRVDIDPLKLPPPTSLSTGVFLRNQNRRPTAVFSATRTSGGFVLNGSASVDPEGDPLRYVWCKGSAACKSPDDPLYAGDPNRIGTGITFTYTGLTPGTVYPIHLDVFDPAGLLDTSAVQEVTA